MANPAHQLASRAGTAGKMNREDAALSNVMKEYLADLIDFIVLASENIIDLELKEWW